MADVPHIFFDAALTNQFDDAVDKLSAAAINGASGDGVFYVGTPTAGNKVEAESDPGVDPITVSIVDASPGGGVEASHIKLALTSGGLDSAVGGNPVNLPATINHGTPQAVHYRWDNSTGGESTEISLSVVSRVEAAQ